MSRGRRPRPRAPEISYNLGFLSLRSRLFPEKGDTGSPAAGPSPGADSLPDTARDRPCGATHPGQPRARVTHRLRGPPVPGERRRKGQPSRPWKENGGSTPPAVGVPGQCQGHVCHIFSFRTNLGASCTHLTEHPKGHCSLGFCYGKFASQEPPCGGDSLKKQLSTWCPQAPRRQPGVRKDPPPDKKCRVPPRHGGCEEPPPRVRAGVPPMYSGHRHLSGPLLWAGKGRTSEGAKASNREMPGGTQNADTAQQAYSRAAPGRGQPVEVKGIWAP